MRFIIILAGIWVAMILVGYSKQAPIVEPKKFSGDHTTPQIRGMWTICYQARVNRLPNTPPIVHVNHCDCFVDNSRERFSSGDYENMGSDNLTNVFSEISSLCNIILEPIETA